MQMRTIKRKIWGILFLAFAIKVVAAQSDPLSDGSTGHAARVPEAVMKQQWEPVCKPLSQRTGELGCWITAHVEHGVLPPRPIFWHLYTYSKPSLADAAKGERGTVVQSFGKVWLLAIDEEEWRPKGGTFVAKVGPLPVSAETKYSAQYMEAIFSPGMTAPAHRHSGPEAWYTLSGETCLETPAGMLVGRAGGSQIVVPSGPPMHLTAAGKKTRRALVLILHDSSKAPTTPAHDWTPKGLCKQ